MFHPRILIDSKPFCEIRQALLHDVFVPYGTHHAHSFLMSIFSANMRSPVLFEILTLSASFAHFQSKVVQYHFVDFWRGHFIWSNTAMFVRLRLSSATLYFYCWKQLSRFAQRLWGFGWTQTYQMILLYHITLTNFSIFTN